MTKTTQIIRDAEDDCDEREIAIQIDQWSHRDEERLRQTEERDITTYRNGETKKDRDIGRELIL